MERNHPCPCGSGKKYKKCCLLLENELPQVVSTSSEIFEACDAALMKIESGDIQGGEIEAERLYDLYPYDYMVNYLQGVCSISRESYQDAIYFFVNAIAINPKFCEGYYNLANAFLHEHQMPESITCFRKIIEIQGENGELGKLAKQRIDSISGMLQKISGITMENYLNQHKLFEKAHEALKQKRYEKAISSFKQVLILEPKHVQSYGNIALAYSALGEQKIALQYVEKALLLDPTYEPAKQNKEVILKLKEGERNSFSMLETEYYKEKFMSQRKTPEKPTTRSWSPEQVTYLPIGSSS